MLERCSHDAPKILVALTFVVALAVTARAVTMPKVILLRPSFRTASA